MYKRRILAIIAVIFILNFFQAVSASTYYISQSGNDSNDGLTETTPWGTMNKIITTTFEPGDVIKFKTDETWQEYLNFESSGTEANPIKITSYGGGAKPIIVGGIRFYAFPQMHDVIVDGFELDGTAIRDPLGLEAAYRITIWNNILDAKNFAGRSGVVIGSKEESISNDNLIADNMIINCGNDSSPYGVGVQITGGSSYNTVVNNTILNCVEVGLQTYSTVGAAPCRNNFFIGNKIKTDWTDKSSCINFGWMSENNIAEHNYCENTHHGIDIDSAISAVNIYRNNIVYNSMELAVIMANSYGNSGYSIIENNTFIAGPATVKGVWYVNYSSYTGMGHIFRNNIVTAIQSWWPVLIIGEGMQVQSDYNLFWGPVALRIEYNGKAYSSLSEYQNASNKDIHSVFSDPMITDIANSNFTPQYNSPACIASDYAKYKGALQCSYNSVIPIQKKTCSEMGGACFSSCSSHNNCSSADYTCNSGICCMGACSAIICIDADGDKYNASAPGCGIADCNETNAEINPSKEDICNSNLDEDCDGEDKRCKIIYNIGPIKESEKISKQIGINETIEFEVETLQYSIKLLEITADEIKIEIRARKITSITGNIISIITGQAYGEYGDYGEEEVYLIVSLRRGESRSFDMNKDGIYEVRINANTIAENTASIEVERINERVEIPPVTDLEQQQPLSQQTGKEIICGDSKCSSGETASNCCIDCGCAMGEECKSNQCVVTQKATATQINNLMIASLASLLFIGVIIYIVYSKMQKDREEIEGMLEKY
ncbi:MAG: hypothetical protein V1660_01790 [archaeon]